MGRTSDQVSHDDRAKGFIEALALEDSDRAAALDLMHRIGGDFAKNLAKAWMHADAANHLHLCMGFGWLLMDYHRMIERRESLGSQREDT